LSISKKKVDDWFDNISFSDKLDIYGEYGVDVWDNIPIEKKIDIYKSYMKNKN
jgi:hypothetical protein